MPGPERDFTVGFAWRGAAGPGLSVACGLRIKGIRGEGAVLDGGENGIGGIAGDDYRAGQVHRRIQSAGTHVRSPAADSPSGGLYRIRLVSAPPTALPS